MKRNSRRWLKTSSSLLLLLALFAPAASAAPPAKVNLCHIPPGNPDNFHTITVSEKALAAHLAHGDLAGDCNDFCEALCDDGDACTVDACDAERGCAYSAVDCDDGNTCTEDDACDAQAGCLNLPLPGTPCDDGNQCTAADSCDAGGACIGESLEGCCLDAVDCDDGRLCTEDLCEIAPGDVTGTCINQDVTCEGDNLCVAPICDEQSGGCLGIPITCTPLDQCHEEGLCDPDTGACSTPAKPDGAPCDDGDPATDGEECRAGVCTVPAGAGGCPCVAQPGWLDKVQFLTASQGCSANFFPQTFFVLGFADQGAALALYNFGDILCEWQDTGLPLNSQVFQGTLAEFESCRAVMTCL